jgi:hypothetical protein
MPQVMMALRILRLALGDMWQELWTILVVQLFFLFAIVLVIPGPPAILAYFYYGNQIAHEEPANERDFLKAIKQYWTPAWRWGFMNILIVGLLTGDYYLIGNLIDNSNTAYFIQGMYITLLVAWFILQLFAIPFLFEQKQPSVMQALRNAAVFIGKNLIFVLTLALLMVLSLFIGVLVFMLTFAFGAAFVAFASNRAVLKDLAAD